MFAAQHKEIDDVAKKQPAEPVQPSPDEDQEPTSESVRIYRDLVEMAREICFHTKGPRGRRLKLTQYLDSLLRPVLLKEYEAFKRRRKEE